MAHGPSPTGPSLKNMNIKTCIFVLKKFAHSVIHNQQVSGFTGLIKSEDHVATHKYLKNYSLCTTQCKGTKNSNWQGVGVAEFMLHVVCFSVKKKLLDIYLIKPTLAL